MYDIIIIGGGPAGVSAALTAKNRGKSVLVISNDSSGSDLYKTKHIGNYPGLSNISGSGLVDAFRKQLEEAEVEVMTARVLSAMAMGESFYVSVGADNYQCRAIILSTGTARRHAYPGENEFLGKGVSYCATCDGMLFRGKNVAVIGLSDYAQEEAEFLRSIDCQVEFFDKARAKKYEIKGDERVTSLVADGVEYPVSGVFILRSTIAPESLIAGLEIIDGHIAVNPRMETSVPGVYAAGDCIGRPYQIARATGQGNTAAIAASEFLDKK